MGHAGARAGNQQDLVARRRVQVHVNERLAVEGRQLRGVSDCPPDRCRIELVTKGRFSMQAFHDRRRHVRQRGQILLGAMFGSMRPLPTWAAGGSGHALHGDGPENEKP